MERFYVTEVEGGIEIGAHGKAIGLTCQILDRAYLHRVVWLDRTEHHGNRKHNRRRLRAEAAAKCAELNAEDAV